MSMDTWFQQQAHVLHSVSGLLFAYARIPTNISLVGSGASYILILNYLDSSDLAVFKQRTLKCTVLAFKPWPILVAHS